MDENNRIVPDTEKNAVKCRCPGCPAYNECMKNNTEFFSAQEAVQNVKYTKEDVYACIAQLKKNIN